MTRHFARSPHGTRARASAPINVGPNVSIAAAIRLEVGIIAAMSVEGAFDGEAFLTFVKEILAPALQPGDHVVMDNLGAHRMAGVINAVEAVGANVLFLPPYSPDLNPIEQFWSTFKEWLRSAAARTNEALQMAITDGLELATCPRTLGWFKDSGYFQCKLKPL